MNPLVQILMAVIVGCSLFLVNGWSVRKVRRWRKESDDPLERIAANDMAAVGMVTSLALSLSGAATFLLIFYVSWWALLVAATTCVLVRRWELRRYREILDREEL